MLYAEGGGGAGAAAECCMGREGSSSRSEGAGGYGREDARRVQMAGWEASSISVVLTTSRGGSSWNFLLTNFYQQQQLGDCWGFVNQFLQLSTSGVDPANPYHKQQWAASGVVCADSYQLQQHQGDGWG